MAKTETGAGTDGGVGRDGSGGSNKGMGSERKTDRLEAFSDAVLAIAITLPVVALEAPHIKPGQNLGAAYAALWPGYLSYGLSCLVIGLYWAHSHFSGKIVRETDHIFNLLSVLFLATVSFTPFPTRPFIEHLSDAANIRVAATVYTGVLAAPSMFWLVRWHYGATQGMLDPRLAPDYVQSLTRKYFLTALIFCVAPFVTYYIDWRLGVAVTALITLRYLLPPMTPRYKPGQEPASELEEPDAVK